jgi:tRNA threonylcarbamoyladenosine modification (KEOPS) complex  Pcc1 subunit
MGTVMSIIANYSEFNNEENIYNNNSYDNIYMGNVLSKMKMSMEQSLMKIKKRMRKDRRAEQIYKEINQEDPTIEMRRSQIIT